MDKVINFVPNLLPFEVMHSTMSCAESLFPYSIKLNWPVTLEFMSFIPLMFFYTSHIYAYETGNYFIFWNLEVMFQTGMPILFFLRCNMLHATIIIHSYVNVFSLPVCIYKLMGSSYIINTLYSWSLCNLRSLEMTLLISHTIFYPVICFVFLRALWHGGRSPTCCSRLTALSRSWKTREKNHPTLAMVTAAGLQARTAVPCSCPWSSAERGTATIPQEWRVWGLPQPLAPLGWHGWDASRRLCRVLSSTPAVRNAFQALWSNNRGS